jgi:hypothetical protein
MKKRYTIRYGNTTTSIINYVELMEILKGDAKGKIVTARVSDDMPKTLHDTIASHNYKIENKQP